MSSNTHFELELRLPTSKSDRLKVSVVMSRLIIFIVLVYRWCISPVLHTIIPIRSGCRFSPTCSEYFIDAVRQQGLMAGMSRGFVRLAKCHPFNNNAT